MVSTRVGPIDDLEFSALLSDPDGVVYRVEEVIAGAVDRSNGWQAKGVPFCFITNNAENLPRGLRTSW